MEIKCVMIRRKGKVGKAHSISSGKPQMKRSLVRHRRTGEEEVKMDLRETA
jgi:hypothetical protein